MKCGHTDNLGKNVRACALKGWILAGLVPAFCTVADDTLIQPDQNPGLTGSYYQVREAPVTLPRKRLRHVSARLGDGSVGVFGGFGARPSESVFLISPDQTAVETLAVDTETWRNCDIAAAGLPGGNALIIDGGVGTVYDYKAKSVYPTLNALEPEYIRWATLTPLSSGLILVSGGDSADFKPLSYWALYDPQQNRFTTLGEMSRPRTRHTATELADGRILIAGGDWAAKQEYSNSSAEILDLSTGKSTLLEAKMGIIRSNHAAVRLDNGCVLFVGGTGLPRLRECEFFDPGTMTFRPTGSLGLGRDNPQLWKCGSDVLVIGGRENCRVVEVYHEESGQFSFNPDLLSNPRWSGYTVVPVDSQTVLAIGGRVNGSDLRLNQIDILTRIDTAYPESPPVTANEAGGALNAVVHVRENGAQKRSLPIGNYTYDEVIHTFQGNHRICKFVESGIADCRAPSLEVAFAPSRPYEERVGLLHIMGYCDVPSIHVSPDLSAESVAEWSVYEDPTALLPTQAEIEAVFPPYLPPDLHYAVEIYDPNRDPATDLKKTITDATREKRHILLQIGGDWCGWCKALSTYFHENKPVRECLSKNYLIMKVNVSSDNMNEGFLGKYPATSGYPHLFVLDSSGRLLHSQSTGELEDGGSYHEATILKFLKKWAPGSLQQ